MGRCVWRRVCQGGSLLFCGIKYNFFSAFRVMGKKPAEVSYSLFFGQKIEKLTDLRDINIDTKLLMEKKLRLFAE